MKNTEIHFAEDRDLAEKSLRTSFSYWYCKSKQKAGQCPFRLAKGVPKCMKTWFRTIRSKLLCLAWNPGILNGVYIVKVQPLRRGYWTNPL
jgi:hypothetical protein